MQPNVCLADDQEAFALGLARAQVRSESVSERSVHTLSFGHSGFLVCVWSSAGARVHAASGTTQNSRARCFTILVITFYF